jgi:hypothetical protein
MVLTCLFSAGCKKKTAQDESEASLESVITNRMNDAAYLEALRKNREEQTAKAGERHVVVTQMQACIERVRATLPKEADDAVLKAALAKDEEWGKLEAQNAQAIGSIEKVLEDARQKVRQRMLEESRAVKAVAEGRAKAVDNKDGK